MPISPAGTVEDFRRRRPSDHRKSPFQIKRRDDELAGFREHISYPVTRNEQGGAEPAASECPLTSPLPFPAVPVMKILGLMVDSGFRFQQHTAHQIDRANVRMGILFRASGFTRGLETNVPRITADALIPSLLCYGLAVYGPGAFGQYLRGLDTFIVKVPARKVLGVGRSARLPALLPTAGSSSIHNLYLKHVAEMLESSLRAFGSTIQQCMQEWALRIYESRGWSSERCRLDSSDLP